MPPEKFVSTEKKSLKPEAALAIKKQEQLRKSRLASRFAIFNGFVLFLIFFDYFFDFFFVKKIFRHDLRPIFIFFEIFFAVILGINLINHLVVVIVPYATRRKFFLNEKQKRLLGIRNSLPGLQSQPPAPPAAAAPQENKVTQGLAWLFRLRKRVVSPVTTVTPVSPAQSWSPSPDSSAYSPTSSWNRSNLTMNGSSAGSYPTPSSSSFSSPDFKFYSFGAADELQNEILRYRRAQSSTPYSTSKQRIRTAEELHDYLQRFHTGSASIMNQSLPVAMTDGYSAPDQSFVTAPVGPGSGLGPGPGLGPGMDWPPRILPNVDLSYLANEKYQPSPLNTVESESISVPLAGSRTGKLDLSLGGASGGSGTGGGAVTQSQLAPIFLSFDLDPDSIDRLAQNLRTWIARTILIPLADEIGQFNRRLQALGRTDLKLGETPLNTFQQSFGGVKDPELVKFFGLIPYVNLIVNQEYMIQRICTLAKGSCLSEFNWDSGGEFKGKRWDEHLPTDSELLMHLLSAYLDGHLKSNPLFSDGKNFSDRFVVVSPQKPKSAAADPQICRISANPPIYQLFVENSAIDFGRDRQNLFFVLLLFFQFFRKNQKNHLAGIDMGPAGLNISWIFEDV